MGICIFFAYISHLFIFYLGTLNTYHVIFILVTFWRVLYFILMGCILIPLGVAGMSVCFTTNVTRLGYFGMSWQQIFKAKVAQTFVDIWIFIYRMGPWSTKWLWEETHGQEVIDSNPDTKFIAFICRKTVLLPDQKIAQKRQ